MFFLSSFRSRWCYRRTWPDSWLLCKSLWMLWIIIIIISIRIIVGTVRSIPLQEIIITRVPWTAIIIPPQPASNRPMWPRVRGLRAQPQSSSPNSTSTITITERTIIIIIIPIIMGVIVVGMGTVRVRTVFCINNPKDSVPIPKTQVSLPTFWFIIYTHLQIFYLNSQLRVRNTYQ